MKNIFRIFAAAVAGVALFASCLNEAAPLASSVSVDKTEANPVGVGSVPVTVKVTADGDWFAITSSEWISVEPANGRQGITEVTLKFADNVDSYNELNGPRSGSVSFCYGNTGVASVVVNQKGENGLDASRTYSKVTKTEDVKAGGYLIVFNVKDGDADNYQALNAMTTITESYYSYAYASPVNFSNDVITTENGLNSFSFEEVEGGYLIATAGQYLFQDGSGFKGTKDKAKAHVWTVSIDEEGYATITNTSCENRYIQFSTGYGSAGAYPSAQDKALMPMLFVDSKPVSDEVLEVPESVMVFNDATSASIKVASNKAWKVRNHDEWIKTFTASGEGNGAIEVTFDALAADAQPRTAEFLVIGETANFTVTLTQKVPSSVADMYAQITSTDKNNQSSFMVNLQAPAVVTYVNGNNAFIEDATGGILYYKSGHGLNVGDKISGVIEGTGYKYNGVAQIASITNTPTVEEGEAPAIPTVTIADILADYDRYLSCVVKVEGVEIKDAFTNSDRNGKMAKDGKEINVYVQNKNANPAFNVSAGTVGDIICIPTLYNTTKQVGIWEAAHFTATKVVSAISMPAALDCYVDDVKSLNATTNSTATITYVSSDPTVATVAADGKVTALKVGETTITASVAADGICTAAEATCKVTVTEKPAEPVRDGASAATAFTVADAKAYYDASKDKTVKMWVKGAIIGTMVDSKMKEGTTGASNTNMVIGTKDSYLPVQLPSGDVRTALNLQDNPTNLGKEVVVYGTIEAYFSVAGIKNVTKYEF